MRQKFLVLLAMVSFAGCTLLHPYVVKPEDPVSKLRFISKSFGSTFLNHITEERKFFVARTFKQGLFDNKEKSNIKMIGTSDDELSGVRERLISANLPFTFEIRYELQAGYGLGRQCNIRSSFLPEQDGEYELVFDISENKCWVTLNKLGRFGDGTISRNQIPLRAY